MAKKKEDNTSELSIQENFAKLEEVLSILETGKTGLEDAFKLYNDGIELINSCSGQIDRIEKQIIVLQNGEE